MPLTIVTHPLVRHKISELRNASTDQRDFRRLVSEITLLLAVPATADLATVQGASLKTPLNTDYVPDVISTTTALFPILRSGTSMLDTFLDLLPTTAVYHLGLYREKHSFLPVEYYNKLPSVCNVEQGIILDPMIATAGTATAAINILKEWGVRKIKLVAIIASKQGLQALQESHPDVEILVGAIDVELSHQRYILPGLGDVGDRLFNTGH
jgi:uracil phosphoribosyltransferase